MSSPFLHVFGFVTSALRPTVRIDLIHTLPFSPILSQLNLLPRCITGRDRVDT